MMIKTELKAMLASIENYYTGKSFNPKEPQGFLGDKSCTLYTTSKLDRIYFEKLTFLLPNDGAILINMLEEL